jgi:tol-pal system protein YbgF
MIDHQDDHAMRTTIQRMIRSRRTLTVTGLLLLSLSVVSCRTSQQRGGASRAQQGAAGNSANSRIDSLLLVEQKLVEVIDSMANLVEADHDRIQRLESELSQLRMQMQRPPIIPQSAPAPQPPPPLMPQANPTPQPPPASLHQGTPVPQPPPVIRLQEMAPPPAPPGQPPPMPPPVVPQPSVMGPTTFADRYEAALDRFHHNDFASALAEFQRLAVEDPNGALASNYLYWQGESFYALRRYNEALQAFGAVLNQYPRSTKAAASQFKIAECYERLNLKPSARDAYQRVLDDYPNSELRSRAESRLKALRY